MRTLLSTVTERAHQSLVSGETEHKAGDGKAREAEAKLSAGLERPGPEKG